MPSLSPIEEIEGHYMPITHIDNLKDSIVSGSVDGEVIIINLAKIHDIHRFKVFFVI